MITKEIFVEYMNIYLKKQAEAEYWWDNLELVFGSGAWERAIQHSAFSFFIEFLEKAMNDNEHWLTYWCYEQQHSFPFTYYNNDLECSINNLEELYDLIMIKPVF